MFKFRVMTAVSRIQVLYVKKLPLFRAQHPSAAAGDDSGVMPLLPRLVFLLLLLLLTSGVALRRSVGLQHGMVGRTRREMRHGPEQSLHTQPGAALFTWPE